MKNMQGTSMQPWQQIDVTSPSYVWSERRPDSDHVVPGPGTWRCMFTDGVDELLTSCEPNGACLSFSDWPPCLWQHGVQPLHVDFITIEIQGIKTFPSLCLPWIWGVIFFPMHLWLENPILCSE